jgi:hypothetical protein
MTATAAVSSVIASGDCVDIDCIKETDMRNRTKT